MWRHAGSKYWYVGTQPKIASPSAETQQHGASGLQLAAQGPRKCLTCSGVPHPEMQERQVPPGGCGPPRRTYPCSVHTQHTERHDPAAETHDPADETQHPEMEARHDPADERKACSDAARAADARAACAADSSAAVATVHLSAGCAAHAEPVHACHVAELASGLAASASVSIRAPRF